MEKEKLLTRLSELTSKFGSRDAELELTVRDHELGLTGFVVVWNTSVSRHGPLRGCAKGGTAISPELTLEEVRLCAQRAALKNGAAGLPIGGAYSGLRASRDDEMLELKYRSFLRSARPFLYENGGKFGGFGIDLDATVEQESWACDELQSTQSFTGKSPALGGTAYSKTGIHGLGLAVAGKSALEARGVTVSGSTFALDGLGVVSASLVREMLDAGSRLVALSDVRIGGAYEVRSEELSLVQCIEEGDYHTLTKRLQAQQSHQISRESLLYKNVDLLFLCGSPYVITAANCDRVQAKVVIEGVHSSLSDAAIASLSSRGRLLIPEFIARVGGAIAAYTEMCAPEGLTAAEKSALCIERAKEFTARRVSENVRHIFDLVQRHQVSAMEASLYVALVSMEEER